LRPAGKPESDEDEDTKVIISHPSMNRNEGENRQRRRTAIQEGHDPRQPAEKTALPRLYEQQRPFED
jgi:hypothetical protein